MKNVMIWFNQPSEQPKGIPAREDVTYTDDFNPKKPMYGADAPWLDYNHQLVPFPPPSKELEFPNHLFVVIKKNREVLFDFLPLDINCKIISKELLEFYRSMAQQTVMKLQKLLLSIRKVILLVRKSIL